MSMILRYDMQSDTRGVHPQKAFELDGLTIIRAEASSYGGCWFIEMEPKDNLPEWYSPSNWSFTFPDKKFSSDL